MEMKKFLKILFSGDSKVYILIQFLDDLIEHFVAIYAY